MHSACPACYGDSTNYLEPVTVAERSKAWTVFAFSVAEIVGSNSIYGMDVLYVYAFVLCSCCAVLRLWPWDGLMTRTRSPSVCAKWLRNWIEGRPIAQVVSRWLYTAAARVRARVWSCGICGGQSSAGAGFLWVLRFPLLNFIPPIAPKIILIYHRSLYNRPKVAAVPRDLVPPH
jgi:hypothetical protein